MGEAKGKIFKAIPIIMSEVGAIEKNRTNQQGSGYKFRGIDDVYAALQPLLHKHGVFFVPTVLETVREERQSKSGGNLIYTILKVKYTFFADDGSTFDSIVSGEAMDSGDKSSNKAMSAALKYVLLQVFCIPTEEEKDTEYHSPEVKPKFPNPSPTVRPATNPLTPSPITPKANADAPGVWVPGRLELAALTQLCKSRSWITDKLLEYMNLRFAKNRLGTYSKDEYDALMGVVKTQSADDAIAGWNQYLATHVKPSAPIDPDWQKEADALRLE